MILFINDLTCFPKNLSIYEVLNKFCFQPHQTKIGHLEWILFYLFTIKTISSLWKQEKCKCVYTTGFWLNLTFKKFQYITEMNRFFDISNLMHTVQVLLKNSLHLYEFFVAVCYECFRCSALLFLFCFRCWWWLSQQHCCCC